MTREDYIKNLQSMIDDAENMGLYEEDVESLQMAIKALEYPEKNVVAIVPCGDAISRQAVIELIDQQYPMLIGLKAPINELPTVIPQPKTGHWVEHEMKDTCRWLTCSICGYEWVNKKENYCPNCGAKMEIEG